MARAVPTSTRRPFVTALKALIYLALVGILLVGIGLWTLPLKLPRPL